MSKHVTGMTLDGVRHYTPEQRQALIDGYPVHEREARTRACRSSSPIPCRSILLQMLYHREFVSMTAAASCPDGRSDIAGEANV